MNWSSLINGAAKLATALAGDDASAPAATVAGHTFTAGDLQNGYAGLKAALASIEKVIANPTTDDVFNTVELLEKAAADLGIPYANLAYLITRAAQFAVDNNLAAKLEFQMPRPGFQLPGFTGGDESNPSRGR